MKTSFFFLFLIGATLTALSAQTVLADDGALSGQAAPSTTPADAQRAQRIERFKTAMAELNLTDAQKDQIKEIRANVADRMERRQQIMAVLTPDQKAKLRELIQEHRNGAQAGSGTPSAN